MNLKLLNFNILMEARDKKVKLLYLIIDQLEDVLY